MKDASELPIIATMRYTTPAPAVSVFTYRNTVWSPRGYSHGRVRSAIPSLRSEPCVVRRSVVQSWQKKSLRPVARSERVAKTYRATRRPCAMPSVLSNDQWMPR